MREYEYDGAKYRIDNLPNFPAMHVARKILPLAAGFSGLATVQQEFAELFSKTEEGTEGVTPKLPTAEELAAKLATMVTALQPLLELLSNMSEKDSEFVVKTCLKYVYKLEEKSASVVFNASADRFQYAVNLPTMLMLTAQSIMENLSDFFPAKASAS